MRSSDPPPTPPPPVGNSPAVVVVTNDDGYDAPGLTALAQAVRAAGLGEPVMVAPAEGLSGCGHQVTADRPIVTTAVPAWGQRPAGWVVNGTPADCVRVALMALVGRQATVVSGINAGGNLGADVYISGTVAAAREAALHGNPAVAVSHYRRREGVFDWPRAARWTADVLRRLLIDTAPQSGRYWNVNLPDPAEPPSQTPPVAVVPLEFGPMPVSFARNEAGHLVYNGVYHSRVAHAGHDVAVCFGGAIAVTSLDVRVP